MAATGYTPIILFNSTSAGAQPTTGNLAAGELALNIADGKLYFNKSGVITVLANANTAAPVTTISFGTTGLTPATATSGAITVAGTLAVANGGTGVTTSTGTGSVVLSNSPTLVTPVLGVATGTSINVTASALTSSNTSNLGIGGNLGFSDTGVLLHSVASLNGYLQNVIQNTNSGSSASAEFTAYNNNGSASTNYATFGINSSGYSGTGSINAAGYGYFLSGSTDIVVGTIGANAIHLTVNSSATDALSISSAGLISVNSNTAGTALFSIAGSATTPALKIPNIVEAANIVGAAPASTQTFYLNLGSVQYYTTNAANNWTVNIGYSSSTTMNTAMTTGDSMSMTMITTQGSTAYYNTAIQVDGTTSGVTTKWQGSAPTSGNASALDVYTYVVIKTGSATFTVIASQTKFA